MNTASAGRCDMDMEWQRNLADLAAEVYVQHSGLSCLCRWPTHYKKSMWLLLMEVGKEKSHFWFAHTIPMYALMFMDLDKDEEMAELIKMPAKYGLEEAACISLGQHITSSGSSRGLTCMKACLSGISGMGCSMNFPHTTTPIVPCLQKFMQKLHGFNVAEKMGRHAWVLSWAHMLGTCAQLRSYMKQDSMQKYDFGWLDKGLKTMMDRYGACKENGEYTISRMDEPQWIGMVYAQILTHCDNHFRREGFDSDLQGQEVDGGANPSQSAISPTQRKELLQQGGCNTGHNDTHLFNMQKVDLYAFVV